MPLNKLENFIKNTEGRILYVNPNDLDSTDGIENQGNSLTKPFKTIQRALIEAARFSYLRGDDNDLVERTTILLYPGEHTIDNRPGWGIKTESGQAKAVSPAGVGQGASNVFELTLDSNFDLTQEDNILYKFNSVNGGVVVPRGTSIVGLDLRKTKLRPLYVPNPTDSTTRQTAIFRITGACYFWQFTFFDGNETGTVYTDPSDFSDKNKSKPTFSHHKVTCFEYADGVNTFDQFSGLTDLDIYYSKLTNAFNIASGRDIQDKYPLAPDGFAPQRPEFEIVGAFATDPLNITTIESGNGLVPGQQVTVTTAVPHNLTGGTPIKIRGVNVPDFNISTKVAGVINSNTFTYLLPFVRANLPAGPAGGLSAANAQVLVETDTVTGASPYIFNISMRSVFGMQGMHADGSKADGFKSMVVAQFTAVSLQKDDRAFVKYDPTNRKYSGIAFSKQTGELLSSESSSTNPSTVYHLDQEANYRKGFRTSHIKVSNDAVVQIVSVFAIGFHSHFNMITGADASITNSNSNFGTFALAAEGFKKEAFAKDDKGFVTSIITPRSVVSVDRKIEYLQIDTTNTNENRLYLFQQTDITNPPAHIAQGFRIGARVNEKIKIDKGSNTFEATIVMSNGTLTGTTDTSQKTYEATHSSTTATLKNVFTIASGHNLQNGETIRIISDKGDLPENIEPHTVYFAITQAGDSALGQNDIRIAASKTNAQLANPIFINTIASTSDKFTIISRVSDKKPNDAGHPIQYDTSKSTWFIHTLGNSSNTIHPPSGSIYSGASTDDITFFLRRDDDRSLDDKVYKVRYVIPKELVNARDPIDGFVLQDSSSTNVTAAADFSKPTITQSDYAFDRNTRFISQLSFDSGTNEVLVRSDKPHNVNVGDQVIVRNVKSNTNTSGADNKGYNGTFLVTAITNSKEFKYSNTDTLGKIHSVGTFTNTTHTRDTQLPRFDRNNNQDNLFIYRSEVISPYIQGDQDGIYHLFVLNGDNAMNEISNEFGEDNFNQNIVNLYPEYDRDNVDDNPPSAVSFAKRFPIGDVETNDLKKSITRETTNKFLESFDASNTVSSVSDSTTTAVLTFNEQHEYQALKFHNNLTGGSGHTNGTYHNVKLYNDVGMTTWDGATAQVVVSGGSVTSLTVEEGGSGYANGETLHIDNASVATGGIAGPANASITIATAGISSALGNYVQVTGITTGTDNYFRIDSVNNINQITIKKTSAETILNGQQVIDLGPWRLVSTSSHDVSTNVHTFNTSGGHGLNVGNSFRVLNASDTNLGDFVVKSVVDVNTFTATTNAAFATTTPKYILKHGLSANDSLSTSGDENLVVRGTPIFDHETLIVNESPNGIKADDSSFKVLLPNGDTSTAVTSIRSRFPIGSYIQVNGEIMRISSTSIGSGNEISVIRGALGTIISDHPHQSLIKKIKPLPIEFRRPSILRASGHTFEYVGYGPGNYSTALPQLQNRTLSEREEFLSQSQETSCGNVVYTGMNDKGDFYIGNTKISSSSGQQTTFDIPIPTITGEDPNRLSAVFDEVIVKERLLVEGGASKQILSQFDGPVTFNGDITNNKELKSPGKIRITNDTNILSNLTDGSFVTKGGAGIDKDLIVNGSTTLGKSSNQSVKFNARIDSHLIPDNPPSAAPTYDLGDSTDKWRNGYFTTLYGDGSNLTGIDATSLKDSNGNIIVQADANGIDVKKSDGSKGTVIGNLTGDVTGDVTGNLTGNVTGNVTGNLTGTATKVNLSVEASDTNTYVTFSKSASLSQELHTNSGLRFDSSGGHLTVAKDIISSNGFLYLNGNNGGDIHSAGGADGKMVIQNTTNYDASNLSKSTIDIGGKYNNSDVNIAIFLAHNSATLSPELRVAGDIVAFSSSDIKLKKDVKPITNSLDKINAISGNTFTWIDNSTEDVGVIAQEVEKLGLPGITTTRDNGIKAVKYEKLVPILIEAVKELSAKVTALENK